MSAWDILEIEKTTDIKVIKKAYARLVKVYHPEDDPDGYERLRWAYEWASQFAVNNQSIDNPVELEKKNSDFSVFETMTSEHNVASEKGETTIDFSTVENQSTPDTTEEVEHTLNFDDVVELSKREQLIQLYIQCGDDSEQALNELMNCGIPQKQLLELLSRYSLDFITNLKTLMQLKSLSQKCGITDGSLAQIDELLNQVNRSQLEYEINLKIALVKGSYNVLNNWEELLPLIPNFEWERVSKTLLYEYIYRIENLEVLNYIYQFIQNIEMDDNIKGRLNIALYNRSSTINKSDKVIISTFQGLIYLWSILCIIGMIIILIKEENLLFEPFIFLLAGDMYYKANLIGERIRAVGQQGAAHIQRYNMTYLVVVGTLLSWFIIVEIFNIEQAIILFDLFTIFVMISPILSIFISWKTNRFDREHAVIRPEYTVTGISIIMLMIISIGILFLMILPWIFEKLTTGSSIKEISILGFSLIVIAMLAAPQFKVKTGWLVIVNIILSELKLFSLAYGVSIAFYNLVHPHGYEFSERNSVMAFTALLVIAIHWVAKLFSKIGYKQNKF